MRLSIAVVLCLLSSVAPAGPIFWDHPAVRAALGEDGAPYEVPGPLDIEAMMRESPQSYIWYLGGDVGYFRNEWRAPIWTTPWIEEIPDENLDPGPLVFAHYLGDNGGPNPGGDGINLNPAPGPGNGSNNPGGNAPGGDNPALLPVVPLILDETLPNPPAAADTSVPEPSQFLPVALALGAIALAYSRQNRPAAK